MSDNDAPWRDEETLRRLYHNEGLSQREIAERLNCGISTVPKWMDRHGIETRSIAGHRGSDEWREACTEENLRRLHVEDGLSTVEIADKYDVTPGAVYRQLDKYDLCRTVKEATRLSNRVERCTFRTTKDGREIVQSWNPQDSQHDTVFVHRLLAAAEYGVEEIAGKVVHHKNRIPWCNTPDNIEPLDRGKHTSLHRNRGDI
jgi:transposase